MKQVLKIFLVLGFMFQGPSFAVEPGEELEDPVLEARAREISQNLRCVVCQNQSIDDSNAEIAEKLRILIRERLVAGDTNDEAIQFVVARYGDYVLLKPPFKPETYFLWFGPFIFLGLGLLLAIYYFTRVMNKKAKD